MQLRYKVRPHDVKLKSEMENKPHKALNGAVFSPGRSA